MNLLDYCGWKHEPEDFNRHPPLNRFIPLEEVPVDVDDLGDRFASCIAPGGDEYGHPLSGLWDAAYYLITELANNIRQHSGGRGFLVAQTTARDGFVRIALADCGSGIPESLRSSGITAELPLSDAQNILKALEPRVSTKGQPSNEGVGFTLCARVTQLLKGAMLIHSQRGLVTCNSEGDRQTRTPMGGEGFPGTLITLVIPTADAEQFDARLEDAKNLEGLLRTTGRPAKFFT